MYIHTHTWRFCFIYMWNLLKITILCFHTSVVMWWLFILCSLLNTQVSELVSWDNIFISWFLHINSFICVAILLTTEELDALIAWSFKQHPLCKRWREMTFESGELHDQLTWMLVNGENEEAKFPQQLYLPPGILIPVLSTYIMVLEWYKHVVRFLHWNGWLHVEQKSQLIVPQILIWGNERV